MDKQKHSNSNHLRSNWNHVSLLLWSYGINQVQLGAGTCHHTGQLQFNSHTVERVSQLPQTVL